MKFRDKGANKLLSLVILFAGVGVLLVSALPSVMAMNMSPSAGTDPPTPVVGGTMTVILQAGPNLDHVDGIVRIYEPGKAPTSNTNQFQSGDCSFAPTVGPGPANRKVIEFRQASDDTKINRYRMNSAGDELRIPVTSGTVTPTKIGTVTLEDNDGVWKRVEGGAGSGLPDSIDFFTIAVGASYRLASCGYDFGTSPSGDPVGTTEQFNVNTPIPTQLPVAGEILPIDTTALLIAGITSSPMWILPALGVAAGVAVALLKFQLRKQD